MAFGTKVTWNSGITDYIRSIKIDDTRILNVFSDGLNSSYGTVIIGTVSGTSISFGTKASFTTSGCYDMDAALLDSTHVVVAFINSSNGRAYARVGTISGSTITFSGMVPTSVLSTSSGGTVRVIAMSSTNFQVQFQDGNNSNRASIRQCSVDGITITVGGLTQLNATTGTPLAQIKLNTSDYVNFYNEAGSYGYAKVNSGTAYAFFVGSVLVASACRLDDTHFAIIYRKPSVLNGCIKIGTVSGTTITFGSEYVFANYTVSEICVASYDSTNLGIVFRKEGAPVGGVFIKATVSGTVVSFGTAVNYLNYAAYYNYIVPLDSSKAVITFKDFTSNLKYGTSIVDASSTTHQLTSSISESSSSDADLTQEVVEGVLLTTTISQTSSSSISAQKELLSRLDISETSSSSTAAQKELSAVSSVAEATSVSTSLKQNFTHKISLPVSPKLAVSENLNQEKILKSNISQALLSFEKLVRDRIVYATEMGYANTDITATNIETVILDETRFFTLNLNNTATACIGTKNSNNTISWGSTSSLAGGLIVNYVKLAKLDSTHIAVMYVNLGTLNTGGLDYSACSIATISGNSISFGSENILEYRNSSTFRTCPLTSTSFVFTYENSSSVCVFRVATVSGNTVSYGAEQTFTGAKNSYLYMRPLDSTHLVIGYDSAATTKEFLLATVSGSAISFGNRQYLTNCHYEQIRFVKSTDTSFLVLYADNTANKQARVIVASTSDYQNISIGSNTLLPIMELFNCSIDKLTDNTFLINSRGKSWMLKVDGNTLILDREYKLFFDSRTITNTDMFAFSKYYALISYEASLYGYRRYAIVDIRYLHSVSDVISTSSSSIFNSKIALELSAQITQISETSNALYKSLGLDLHIAQNSWIDSWVQKAQTIVLTVEQLSTSTPSVENIKAIQALLGATSSSTSYLQMQKLLTSDISELSIAETALSLELGLNTEIESTTTSVLKIISAWGLATEILSTSGSSASLTLDLILTSLISQSSELTGVPAKTDLLKSDILSQLSQISTVDKMAVLKEYIVSTTQSSSDLELTHLLMDWINANTSIEENITKTSDIITHLLSNASLSISPLLELYLTDEIITTSQTVAANEILVAFRLDIASDTTLKFDSRRFADVAVLMQQATQSEISIDRYIELISNLDAEAKIFFTSEKYSNLLAEINQDTTVAIRIQELIRAYLEYRSRLQQALTFDGLLHGQLSTSGQLNLQLYFEGNIKNV